jgi:ribosome-binding factor A
MSIRTERVAGEVQQAIARLFQTEFTDLSDGMITVTKVRMAPDLKSGRVYVSVLGGTAPGQVVLKRIKESAPQIRYQLGKTLNLRFNPEIFYYLDDTQEEVSRVEEIFRKIREEQQSKEPREGDGGNTDKQDDVW